MMHLCSVSELRSNINVSKTYQDINNVAMIVMEMLDGKPGQKQVQDHNKGRNQELIQQIVDLRNQLKDKEQQIIQLEKDVQDASINESSKIEELQKVQQEYEDLNSDYNGLREKNKQLQKQIDELKSDKYAYLREGTIYTRNSKRPQESEEALSSYSEGKLSRRAEQRAQQLAPSYLDTKSQIFEIDLQHEDLFEKPMLGSKRPKKQARSVKSQLQTDDQERPPTTSSRRQKSLFKQSISSPTIEQPSSTRKRPKSVKNRKTVVESSGDEQPLGRTSNRPLKQKLSQSSKHSSQSSDPSDDDPLGKNIALNKKRSQTPGPKGRNTSQNKIPFPFKKSNESDSDDAKPKPNFFIPDLETSGKLNIIPEPDVHPSPQVILRERELGPCLLTYQLNDGVVTKMYNNVKLQDGSIYNGCLTPNTYLRHGYGEQVYPDGSKYSGSWQSDIQHGKGRMVHSDGSYYEGEWDRGNVSGHGKLVKSNGTYCIGRWKEGKPHGHAEEVFDDKSKYIGDYVNGEKHGYGKLFIHDGSFYEGEFANNMFNGQGKYAWADGRKYTGGWLNGKMHERGVFEWKDGSRYEGEYQHDKKEGYGVFEWPNKKKYEGMWADGKQHGEGLLYVGNKVLRGYWEAGKRMINQI